MGNGYFRSYFIDTIQDLKRSFCLYPGMPTIPPPEPTIRTIRESIPEVEDLPRSGDPLLPTGFDFDSVLGDGSNKTCAIDSGSTKRSWLWVSAYSTPAAGQPTQLDITSSLYAADPDETIGTQLIGIIPASHAELMVWYRIPRQKVQLLIPGSTNTTSYTITGMWIEDR